MIALMGASPVPPATQTTSRVDVGSSHGAHGGDRITSPGWIRRTSAPETHRAVRAWNSRTFSSVGAFAMNTCAGRGWWREPRRHVLPGPIGEGIPGRQVKTAMSGVRRSG